MRAALSVRSTSSDWTKPIDGVAVTALYDINKEKTDALAAAYGAESMESVDALICT